MTLEINYEQDGIRLSADIKTLSVEGHSALSEVPKDEVQKIRERIWMELHDLTQLCVAHRKDNG